MRFAVQQVTADICTENGFRQRKDDQRGDAQNDDLTKGIKTPEVDKDHIDHIGAAAAFVGIGQMEL